MCLVSRAVLGASHGGSTPSLTDVEEHPEALSFALLPKQSFPEPQSKVTHTDLPARGLLRSQELRPNSLERLPLSAPESSFDLAKRENYCGPLRPIPNTQDQASCSLKVAPGSQILACSWPAGRSQWRDTLPCPASWQVFPLHGNHVFGPQASSRA